jgi:methyltransferase
VSQRHAGESLRQGGVESGRGHFLVLVALHAGLLIGCWAEPLALLRVFRPALFWPMSALVVGANALWWWCIATLGPRWSARVIVMPGMPLVRADSYRWFAHPNYVAVVVDGAFVRMLIPVGCGDSSWVMVCKAF